MEAFLTNTVYFILAIFPLVVIHELGHFLAAKLTKTRADVFAVGMGPRLFGWNRKDGFSFGKLDPNWDGEGCTDYRLSLLPVGGYVRILGMVDESMTTEFMNKPVQPWEFRAKGTWAKMFMISAGVIMNLLLALVILVGLNVVNGKTVLATRTIAYVKHNSFAERVGFRSGDEVISVNNKAVDNFQDFERDLMLDNIGHDLSIVVLRQGQQTVVPVKATDITTFLESKDFHGLFPDGSRTYIEAVEPGTPAQASGFTPGDTVLSIQGAQIYSSEQFQDSVRSNIGRPLHFEVRRGGDLVNMECAPSAAGTIGVGIVTITTGKIVTTRYGVFEAVAVGFRQMKSFSSAFLNMVGMIIKGQVSAKKSLGGPLAIAKTATQSAQNGLATFLVFMSTLSVTLAVLNILPIPALDGGHLVFIIIEGVTKREVPDKVKMAFQQIGFFALLALMAFVFYNDLTR